MSSTYGDNLKLSIFGQSHGGAIGMTLDGIPAGLPVDTAALQSFLNRRAPGHNLWSTPRKEEDKIEFLSGIVDNFTCGAPLAAVIYNHNTRSGDYNNLKDCPRPGHADYTAQVKYGGYQDSAGGGHFSGRLTAPLCIAGGLCKQWLEEMGITVSAHILCIGSVQDTAFDPIAPQTDSVLTDFPVLSSQAGADMQNEILKAKGDRDSVGGMIECAVTGLPAGLGEPIFGGVESKIAAIVYAIPAVKAVAFGAGEAVKDMRGSICNDPFLIRDGIIRTETNHAGGILGGITNGMPVLFRAAIKPTPSISRPQMSISLSRQESAQLQIQGRHDPCIVPRAVPVVEAAAAIAIYDLILRSSQTNRRKNNGSE